MIASTSYRDVWSFRRHPCRHHVFHNRDHCNALGGWWFLNRCFIDENPSISGKLWDFLPRYKRHDSSVLAGGSCDITVIWIRIHVSGIRICGDLFDAHTFVPFHLNVSQTLEVLDFPCAQSRFGEQTCFRFVVKSFSGIPFPKTEEAPPGARHPVNSKW